MTQGVLEQASAAKAGSTSTKYVYFFGGGKADGNGKMKDVLGGKGAGLAEMTNAGLPVPPGFTIQTEACREYMRGKLSPAIETEMLAALDKLEKLQGQKLGAGDNPLLVSVRSGAKFSMPGMMDTILNLGLNDQAVEALAKLSNNPRFAYDSYRRLIQMFGDVVLDIPKKKFEHIFDGVKAAQKVKFDYELQPAALQEDHRRVQKAGEERDRQGLPAEPARSARRRPRRRLPQSGRTSAPRPIAASTTSTTGSAPPSTCSAMVFGNLGENSGTGVGFTRNPATGEKVFFGEYLMNAQGEDVVSGVRTPLAISELEKAMPKVYDQLKDITTRLEKHYRDMQDFEFTIQDGKLYMLQTRNGKRTGLAAVRVAIDMVEEGLITKEEAIFRVEPNQLYDFLVPRLVEKGEKVEVLATGLPASPGAAVGQIVFTAEDAVKHHQNGTYKSIILVRGETTPEDIAGMEVADGILTSRGGMTSHAAVVTRGMGKCCVAGAGDCVVDEAKKELRVKGKTFKQGDWISLDGTTGRVIAGKLKTLDAQPDDPDLVKFMSWADPVRRLQRPRQRRHSPRRQERACLRRRGHRPLPHRAHVLCRGPHRAHAHHDSGRQREGSPRRAQEAAAHAARRLRRSLQGHGRAARSPSASSIRRCTSSCPSARSCWSRSQQLEDTKPRSPKLKELRTLLARVEELHEQNPMLGLRGCRLGITFPEITEMQARAIIEAAVEVKAKGGNPHPEIMIPLVGSIEEMRNQAAIVRRVAEEVFEEKGVKVDYKVGTMIEIPRAALTADQIAEEAEFFSFGTNDLTQTTFGISRDDINNFLPAYLKQGIFKQDPFATLDQAGVGQLVKMAPSTRAARPARTSRSASAASTAAIQSPSSSATGSASTTSPARPSVC